MVWDRCNYSDNIRKPALPPLRSSLSPSLEYVQLGLRNATTLYCPSLPPVPPFTLQHLFVYAAFSTKLYVLFLFPARTSLFHFSVVCKVEFVPVGRKSNEGKSCCYCAAVDVPPHPAIFIDCEPQTRQMLSLYASSAFLHPSSFQEFLITAVFV